MVIGAYWVFARYLFAPAATALSAAPTRTKRSQHPLPDFFAPFAEPFALGLFSAAFGAATGFMPFAAFGNAPDFVMLSPL